MNINNLYEAVPVEKELPPLRSDTLSITVGVCNQLGPSSRGVYDYENNRWLCYGSLEQPTQWLRPVTRERVEEALREFSDKVVKKTMESHYRYIGGFTDNSKLELEAALTELINQTLGQ